MTFFLLEKLQVNDRKDTKAVYNKQSDKPVPLAVSGCFPEGNPFPRKIPGSQQKEKPPVFSKIIHILLLSPFIFIINNAE